MVIIDRCSRKDVPPGMTWHLADLVTNQNPATRCVLFDGAPKGPWRKAFEVPTVRSGCLSKLVEVRPTVDNVDAQCLVTMKESVAQPAQDLVRSGGEVLSSCWGWRSREGGPYELSACTSRW